MAHDVALGVTVGTSVIYEAGRVRLRQQEPRKACAQSERGVHSIRDPDMRKHLMSILEPGYRLKVAKFRIFNRATSIE
jgi:hypothetical protein